jgi:hypothetical protein
VHGCIWVQVDAESGILTSTFFLLNVKLKVQIFFGSLAALSAMISESEHFEAEPQPFHSYLY